MYVCMYVCVHICVGLHMLGSGPLIRRLCSISVLSAATRLHCDTSNI